MSLADKLLWQIEMRLHTSVTLADLSDACAISPYHMARSFRMATGLAPMTYLRARRLSVAASTLANGDHDILTVALDAQYTSHEAFTRAFAAYFATLPNVVRKARSTTNLTLMEPLQMNKDMIIDIPAPDIKTRPAMRITGLSTACTFDDTSAIPGLWQQFNAREEEVADNPAAAYGVCYDADGAGNFRYLAGMERTSTHPLPADMDSIDLPAGRYAVFTHNGHIADLPKTIYTAWNKGLSDAGLEPRQAPDFERYDRRFDVATGRGAVEIWIPVQ